MADPRPAGEREPAPNRRGRVRVCTRCATIAARSLLHRVCRRCGMGVMLTCPARAIETSGLPLAVVTPLMTIGAVSEAAETLLGPERAALGRPVGAVITTPAGVSRLEMAIRGALAGDDVALISVEAAGGPTVPVRRVPLSAFVAACGPPSGAMLVLRSRAVAEAQPALRG